jgi:hypothetical protein
MTLLCGVYRSFQAFGSCFLFLSKDKDASDCVLLASAKSSGIKPSVIHLYILIDGQSAQRCLHLQQLQ